MNDWDDVHNEDFKEFLQMTGSQNRNASLANDIINVENEIQTMKVDTDLKLKLNFLIVTGQVTPDEMKSLGKMVWSNDLESIHLATEIITEKMKNYLE